LAFRQDQGIRMVREALRLESDSSANDLALERANLLEGASTP
jgi:hypothetical protein